MSEAKHAADVGTVVVTGAAGGMGRPAARRLAKAGRRLVLCDLHEDPLTALAEELAGSGAEIHVLAGDAGDAGFPDRLVSALGDTPLGALVHTAGLSPALGDADRILDVNLFATDRLIKALEPRITQGSVCVLISSISAYMVPRGSFDGLLGTWLDTRDPAPLYAAATEAIMAYPLSKAGVIALAGEAATAFGAKGARIVSIAPGFIDTAMGRAEMKVSKQLVEMIGLTPMGRMGLGDEIASVAEFLCSPAASYISGCDIKVDGGYTGRMRL